MTTRMSMRNVGRRAAGWLALGLGALPAAGQGGATRAPLPALEPPIVITAHGKPIEVDTGHAAPFVLDVDGDGKKDLVVGQFAGGKARVYRNVGTDARPRFADHTFLQAGDGDAHVRPG